MATTGIKPTNGYEYNGKFYGSYLDAVLAECEQKYIHETTGVRNIFHYDRWLGFEHIVKKYPEIAKKVLDNLP